MHENVKNGYREFHHSGTLIVPVNNHFEYFCIASEMITNNYQLKIAK